MFFKVWETCIPLGSPVLGNVIGSNYDLIVDWVSDDLKGIPIIRN